MNPPRQREEDKSFWAKMTYYKDKFFIIWAPALLFIGAMGFDFQTPAMATQKLQAQISALRDSIQVLSLERRTLSYKMDILIKLSCVNGKTSVHDLALVGLDCDKFLKQ